SYYAPAKRPQQKRIHLVFACLHGYVDAGRADFSVLCALAHACRKAAACCHDTTKHASKKSALKSSGQQSHAQPLKYLFFFYNLFKPKAFCRYPAQPPFFGGTTQAVRPPSC